MKANWPCWRSKTNPAIAAGLTLAAMTLTSCLALSESGADQPRIWMRSEAYDTAAAVALARSDIDRNDPSLVARDFTRSVADLDGDHLVDHFIPCPRTSSDLIGQDTMNCSLSPGLGGAARDPICPWQTCVVVSVRSETWADPTAREVILSTLADRSKLCAYAREYGPNKRFDAMAAGCDRPDAEKFKIAIEVKPRLPQPCVYKQSTRGEHRSYERICTNPEATLIIPN